jgi:class 3 adenylate cyclase/peptidyl-tRNA hydrolase
MTATAGGALARLSPRRSFAGKLLAALVGTLVVVLAVALAAVRAETSAQVERAAVRAADAADTAFRSIEGIQRARLAEVASRVALGTRALASLEAAVESGETRQLLADVDYELELSQLPIEQLLVVLTDPDGRTIAARAAGRMLEGDDPAGVRSLVDRMYEVGAPETRAYRFVDGRLYNVHTTFLELPGRPVGTFSLGLPLGDAEAGQLGGVVGAEVCFVALDRCVAGTAGTEADLRARLVAAASEPGPTRVDDAGGRWSFSSTALDSADASVGHRVMAVPLDPVLDPFDRISRTLALAGLFALALAGLLGALLARGLARPVRALVDATGRVARGDYEVEVSVETGDELGALARSFNEMTQGLRLKERYRGVLNKVVSPEVADELMQGGVELGGENREITVLFADVRGFTPLTLGMEPQAVIRLLNDCMAVLSAAVDAEGGVVDKYVGDMIMAVFGAPQRQQDHAARALRAALRMRAGMAAVNAARLERGEPPIRIGVGVNSGTAVAGNMGSPERLNYTVLGESVNLASRLCSAAEPDQILASTATVRGAADVEAHSLGERRLKGFAGGIEVFAVAGGGGCATELAATPGLAARATKGALPTAGVVAVLMACGPGALGAQTTESGLPTLEDLGLWWTSPSGFYQAGLSGRLDLEVLVPSTEPAGLLEDTGTFGAARMRLFLDAFAGERVFASAELRADRGETPRSEGADVRLEQLFVRVRPTPAPVELQVGRFASPFGAYGARHHTPADAFIRPPLPYDAHTVVSPGVVPPHRAGFLTWRDRPDEFRAGGSPVIWNVPYVWGALALIDAGALDLRAAWMNSVPSSAPESWEWSQDRITHGALVLGAIWSAAPELTVGASWSRGPFLDATVRGALPTGTDRWDFLQRIFGFEATFTRGPVIARAELFHDSWDVPNVSDAANDLSWYVEAQSDVLAGLWLAARFGAIHYAALGGGGGGASVWDYDVRRLQGSVGYRMVRNAEVKAEWIWNDMSGPLDPSDDLLSLQLWWAY